MNYSNLLELSKSGLCLFRGQNDEFDGSLLPSEYRYYCYDSIELPIPEECKIKGCGNKFLRSNGSYRQISGELLQKYGFKGAEDWLKMKRQVKRLLVTLFGFPLGMSILQQAGFESEGLDLTSNLDVALYFALHKYSDDGYRKITREDNLKPVIYAWRPPANSVLLDMNSYSSYFNGHRYFALEKIWQGISISRDHSEFQSSLISFVDAVICNLDAILIGKELRPFNLLRRPPMTEQDRIILQNAWLVFPDTCYVKSDFLEHGRKNIKLTARLLYSQYNGLIVEDMKSSDEVSCHLIDSDETIQCRSLFPKTDSTVDVILHVISSVIHTNRLFEVGLPVYSMELLKRLDLSDAVVY